MKKSLLALAVAAMAVSTVASAATVYDKDGSSVAVYGRVDATFFSQDSGKNGQSAANDANLNAESRLGFDFRSELSSWATAFAKVEWQNADDDLNPDFNSRYVWTGVDFGQFGAVKFGKFEEAVKYAVNQTDIFEDWGCVGQMGNDDRRDGMVGYSWSGYGVDVNLTYGTAKDGQPVDGAWYGENDSGKSNSNGAEKLDIKAAYSISVGYKSPEVLFGPISVRAGYAGGQMQDRNDGEQGYGSYTDNKYDSYSHWAVSAAWGNLSDGLYLAVMGNARSFDMFTNAGEFTYQGKQVKYDDYTVSGVEAVISYCFANGVQLMTGWEWMNMDMDGANAPDVDAFVVPVHARWQINPNFRIWAEASLDAGTDDEFVDATVSGNARYAENVYQIGARYTF